MAVFLNYLQSLPPELIWLLQLVVCFSGLIVMFRFLGEVGLTVYIAVAFIGANIQVLKVVQFSVFADPVALGTVLFATTYLGTDLLSEFYGKKSARRAILCGFGGLILFNLFVFLALSFAPLDPEVVGEDYAWAVGMHGHLMAVFSPAPALLAAGLIAYLISQYNDVWLFDKIRRATKGRYLWLRNNLSTWISALIDNTIFSLLAWWVFASEPIAMGVIISTYILGTYFLRVIVAVVDTPFIYLARALRPKELKATSNNLP
jgi:uncharacterized integral membrane protein (TIGR00697 family)